MTCGGARMVSGGASNEYRCHETAGGGTAGRRRDAGRCPFRRQREGIFEFSCVRVGARGRGVGRTVGGGEFSFPSIGSEGTTGTTGAAAMDSRMAIASCWRSVILAMVSQPRFKQRDEVRDPAASRVRLPRRRSVDATGYPPLALAGSRWTNRGVRDARGDDGVRVSCVRRARRCFDRATRSPERSHDPVCCPSFQTGRFHFTVRTTESTDRDKTCRR